MVGSFDRICKDDCAIKWKGCYNFSKLISNFFNYSTSDTKNGKKNNSLMSPKTNHAIGMKLSDWGEYAQMWMDV